CSATGAPRQVSTSSTSTSIGSSRSTTSTPCTWRAPGTVDPDWVANTYLEGTYPRECSLRPGDPPGQEGPPPPGASGGVPPGIRLSVRAGSLQGLPPQAVPISGATWAA